MKRKGSAPTHLDEVAVLRSTHLVDGLPAQLQRHTHTRAVLGRFWDKPLRHMDARCATSRSGRGY